MTETPDETPDETPHDAAERRRRLAEVFGDVLPETTSDERDPDGPGEDDSREAWLKDQVPPHH